MQRRSGAKLISILCLLSLLGGFKGQAQQSLNQLELIGRYSLKGKAKDIGGLSALEVSSDGREVILISDRGIWTQGRISRTATGEITEIDVAPMAPTLDAKGNPLLGVLGDSEGIAQAQDGSLYLSFENPARIHHYQSLTESAKPLPLLKEFEKFRLNAEFEALAIDPKGRLFTLPENTRDKTSDFPVYVYDEGWSQPFTLPRRGPFLPVGADFGPDGRFYLLERSFHGLAGFANRIRVFDLTHEKLLSEQEILTTPTGKYDNLEGISVWRDEAGDIRITLVSDDNHLFLLRSEIVEYRLKGN